MIHDIFKVIGFVCIILCVSCSSRDTSNSTHTIDAVEEKQGYEAAPPYQTQRENISLDSLRQYSINEKRHSTASRTDISVDPYYDEGYDNGMEDGYNDGQENVRGDSYDDSSDYRGRKRKEYELGYEEGYDAGFDDGFADSNYDSEEEE